MKAWNITYTIQHESMITTCKTEISSWKSVWKFNLFSSTRLMETHLICIYFFSPCISKIHLKFPSSPTATAWLFFFLQFLHFLMQRYNRAALRGCESLPKPCVGGLFFCQNFTAQQHSTFITFFFVWCKCKIPQLLESLKIWSCYCKECKIWKKPFQVCMCSFGYCMF